MQMAITPAMSPLQETKKVHSRWPMLKKSRKPRKQRRMRASYTEGDMLEAIRLVHEEDYSIMAAARHLNNNKHNEVPRQVVIKTDQYCNNLPKFLIILLSFKIIYSFKICTLLVPFT